MDWVWVRAWIHRWMAPWLLPAWFALNATGTILTFALTPGSFGFDTRLYHEAAQAWVAGQDPWAVTEVWPGFPPTSFAGPPPTLLPFVLLAPVPSDVVVLALALATGAAGVWTLRRLRLPLWWMLFPPIVEGIWVGNLNLLVIALLVAGGAVAGAIATTLKVYAAVPLLLQRQWAALVGAALIVVVTFPFLPWSLFIENYGAIATTLAEQSWRGHTPVTHPLLLTVGGIIGLVLLGLPRASWLAVPVLWPSTQFHYTVIALPALATSPLLASAAAVRQPGLLAVAVMALAVWERRGLLTRRGT